MTNRKYTYTLISLYICSIYHVTSADQECDESKCSGPLAYYNSVGCTAFHDSENSCCPVKYNCDNLKGRSKDKCYYMNKVYELGDSLKEEDAGPCDIGCKCANGYDGIATFTCSVIECFQGSPKPGCYRKNSVDECCPGEEVCPENPNDRARCNVDGKEYLEGDYFTPLSNSTLSCTCLQGYTGENVKPFCKAQSSNPCKVGLRHASDIYNNCTPVFYSSQSPTTDCSVFSRCQNQNDTVIKSEDAAKTEVSDPSEVCLFGNLTMDQGDELNMGTDYSSVCVKCVCEVPPIPTCQRLPDEECDVTVHPPFHTFSK